MAQGFMRDESERSEPEENSGPGLPASDRRALSLPTSNGPGLPASAGRESPAPAPTVREAIQERYRSLTTAERRIADHLSHHYRELAYANASQIGRQLELAASTIVRFAQKLGFDGYPSLQAALQTEVQANHRLVGLAPTGPDFLPAYVETEMENVGFMVSQAESIAQAADLLARARRLWLVGERASHFTAALGHHLLRMVRSDVRLLGGAAGDYPDALLDVEEGDAALIVSMSRYSRRSLRIARRLHDRIPVVLLTDEHASPLLPFAAVPIRFATSSVTSLRSDVGAIATVQALVMAVAQRTAGSAARLERAEALWRDFDVFYTDPPKED
jgi:DNA-binding MurR/RpiR family transcriptional regulator